MMRSHQDSHLLQGHSGLEPMGEWAWVGIDVFAALMLVLGALGYGAGLWVSRDRSSWPIARSVFWFSGILCAAVSLFGPIATAAHTSFTAHMIGHLLLGMAAPLLMVLGAPVSLALRALPVTAARALSRVLRSPGVRMITHPLVAGVLNAGGLWLLYATDLYQVMHLSPVAYAVIHLHIFLAGYVFTASMIGVDPNPHRASMLVRSGVLVAFIAVHSILAKWLYANPPQGVGTGDARVGAQVMYYGGDVVDILLIVLLFASWYSATRPRTAQIDGALQRS